MHYLVIIRPAVDTDDRRLPGRFEVRLDGHAEMLCVSRQPLLDSSRALAAQGAYPDDIIAMRHDGRSYDALRSTIGDAAALTVEESPKVGPRFIRWKPICSSEGPVLVRFERDPAPDIGGAPEPIQASMP